MELQGRIKVWRSEFNGKASYSTSISWHPYKDGKEDKSKWEQLYIPVQFAGSKTDIPNGADVEILHGFLAGFTGKNGNALKIVVTDFDAELPAIEAEEIEEDFAMIEEDAPF